MRPDNLLWIAVSKKWGDAINGSLLQADIALARFLARDTEQEDSLLAVFLLITNYYPIGSICLNYSDAHYPIRLPSNLMNYGIPYFPQDHNIFEVH